MDLNRSRKRMWKGKEKVEKKWGLFRAQFCPLSPSKSVFWIPSNQLFGKNMAGVPCSCPSIFQEQEVFPLPAPL